MAQTAKEMEQERAKLHAAQELAKTRETLIKTKEDAIKFIKKQKEIRAELQQALASHEPVKPIQVPAVEVQQAAKQDSTQQTPGKSESTHEPVTLDQAKAEFAAAQKLYRERVRVAKLAKEISAAKADFESAQKNFTQRVKELKATKNN